MKNILFVLISASLLNACAPGSDGAKAPGPVGGMPTMRGTDLTKRAECKGKTPDDASVYIRGWEVTHKQTDGTEIITKLYFYAKSVSLFSICKNKGVETYANADGESTVADGLVYVTKGATKVSIENKKGIELKCEATIHAPATWTYTFEGPCLRLNDEHGSIVLLPR